MNATEEVKLSEADERIIRTIREAGRALSPREVADNDRELDYNYMRQRLPDLADEGVLVSLDGSYDLPENVEDNAVQEETENYDPMSSNGQRRLPFLSKADLPVVAEAEEQVPGEADEYLSVDSELVKTVNDERRQAIVEVPGNSMSKTISGNSRVVVEIEQEPEIMQGGMYLWVSAHRCVLSARVHFPDGSTVRLVPDNDDYPVIELEGDRDDWAWTCIARVTQVLSGV